MIQHAQNDEKKSQRKCQEKWGKREREREQKGRNINTLTKNKQMSKSLTRRINS